MTGDPSKRTWRVAAAVTLVGLAVAVFAVASWAASDQRLASVTLNDLLESSTEIHAVEATASLCAEAGCVEGWQTDLGAFLRFDNIGKAEYWSTVLGTDSRQYAFFVLDFQERRLSLTDRRRAIDTLYSNRDWW